MAQRKTERLMNLFFVLLATNQYLTKAQIRQAIDDYRTVGDAAFERAFERDKEELRQIGAVIEVGSHDEFSAGVEPGYRIVRDATELPDLALTREESALLRVAAQMWGNTGWASEAATALAKFRAIGVDVDVAAVGVGEPRLEASSPFFDIFVDATTRQIPLRFGYRAPGRESTVRRVQLWGLVSWGRRWYVTGHDVDRQAPRVFRLDRVVEPVEFDGAPGSYERPASADSTGLVRLFMEPEVQGHALINVRIARASRLRQLATSTAAIDEQFEQLTVEYADESRLASLIAGYGGDAVVIEPATLRARVVDQLQRVEAAHVRGQS